MCLSFGPSPPRALIRKFAQTALGAGSPESTLRSECILLVPASQANFCIALGRERCFACPLRAGKAEAREGFKNNPLLSHLLRISHLHQCPSPSETSFSSSGSKEKQQREWETGAEQQGERGPWPSRVGESKPSHVAKGSQARITSHPLPPVQAGAMRVQCQGISPYMCLSCSSPSPSQSMPRQTNTGLQPDIGFFKLFHPSSAQEPRFHICSLTIELSITACSSLATGHKGSAEKGTLH